MSFNHSGVKFEINNRNKYLWKFLQTVEVVFVIPFSIALSGMEGGRRSRGWDVLYEERIN